MLARTARRMRQLAMLLALVFLVQGCHVYMNDFPRKKYKISKNGPPAQRYYDKYDLFNPYKFKMRKKQRQLKRKQKSSRRVKPVKKAAHGQPFPKW